MSGLPDLAGKVAVVTGGASGIGKGIAARLAAEGARVIIADIQRDALEATAAELGVDGIPADVSDSDSVESLARTAVEKYGTVHVVCNNAGIGPLAPVKDLTLDDWRWMLGVNLWGVIHGVHTFLPILSGNPDGGHIVNTASMAGLVAHARLGAYSTAKFGVVALTEALAEELAADGSRVGRVGAVPGHGAHQHRDVVQEPPGRPGRRRLQGRRHRARGQPPLPVDLSRAGRPGGGPRDQARRPLRAHPPGLVPAGRGAPPGDRRSIRRAGRSGGIRPVKDLTIATVEALPCSVPLKQQVTQGLGSVTKRDTVVVKVTTADGLVGYGESTTAGRRWRSRRRSTPPSATC